MDNDPDGVTNESSHKLASLANTVAQTLYKKVDESPYDHGLSFRVKTTSGKWSGKPALESRC